MSELEALLAAQREVGSVESTSSFTLDTLRARQQLASRQLPAPGLWLVKLVQAAVALESEQISVKFGKREVEFSCTCSHWPWCPRELVQELLSGVLPKEPFRFHLYTGLRGSIFEDTVSAEWNIVRDGRNFLIRFSQENTEISETESSDSLCSFRLRTARPPTWPGLTKAAFMPIKHLIRRTADEFMALQSYCWPCPVPLNVDGRPLESRYRSSPDLEEKNLLKLSESFSVSSPTQPLPTVLVRRPFSSPIERPILDCLVQKDEGSRMQVDWGEITAQLKERLYLEETWVVCEPPEQAAIHGLIFFCFAHEMKSRVEFVCDGAVVATHPLPWSSGGMSAMGVDLPQNAFKLGVRVVMAVGTDELDLSHFAVIEAQQLVEAHYPLLVELLRETSEACLEHRKLFKFWFAPRPDARLGKFGSAFLGTLTRLHLPVVLFMQHCFKSELRALLKSLDSEEAAT